MKSFICAVVIFSLLLCGVAVNGIYVSRASGELLREAEGLSESIKDAETAPLRGVWEDISGKLCITVNHLEADAVEDTIAEISARIASGDSAGYLSARTRLIEICRLLHESESLSADRIF